MESCASQCENRRLLSAAHVHYTTFTVAVVHDNAHRHSESSEFSSNFRLPLPFVGYVGEENAGEYKIIYMCNGCIVAFCARLCGKQMPNAASANANIGTGTVRFQAVLGRFWHKWSIHYVFEIRNKLINFMWCVYKNWKRKKTHTHWTNTHRFTVSTKEKTKERKKMWKWKLKFVSKSCARKKNRRPPHKRERRKDSRSRSVSQMLKLIKQYRVLLEISFNVFDPNVNTKQSSRRRSSIR